MGGSAVASTSQTADPYVDYFSFLIHPHTDDQAHWIQKFACKNDNKEIVSTTPNGQYNFKLDDWSGIFPLTELVYLL